ncbi:MAG: hypothetical protein ABI894_03720 [Ilumatobacteraceae bacterium]
MKLLKAVLAWIVLVVKIIAFGWILALISLIKQIWVLIQRWLRRRKLPERQRKGADEDCVTVPPGRVSHPDPLIYSQWELMKLGLAVVWDNPDVQLFHVGAPISSWDLQPATEYEVVARVWNNSTDAPVIGLPVRFYVLSFGIGASLDYIDATSIPVLGVKGGPNHPAFAKVNWTTPATPGHYCLQVILDPADDANYGNNAGAENTLVGVAHSPADFTFELRNDTRRRQTYRFEVDTYQIPELRPCDERDPDSRPPADARPQPEMPQRRAVHVPAKHDHRNHPVPDGWNVEVTPAEPSLDADAAVPIHVQITPPAGFVGRKAFNVNGFNDLGLAGGVTLYVDAS